MDNRRTSSSVHLNKLRLYAGLLDLDLKDICVETNTFSKDQKSLLQFTMKWKLDGVQHISDSKVCGLYVWY